MAAAVLGQDQQQQGGYAPPGLHAGNAVNNPAVATAAGGGGGREDFDPNQPQHMGSGSSTMSPSPTALTSPPDPAAEHAATIAQMLDIINQTKLAGTRPVYVGVNGGSGPGSSAGSSRPGSAAGMGPAPVKWIQPSGPRRPGEGTENEEQGIVSAERTATGSVVVKVTLLAAGFIIGPSGATVRDITRVTSCDIKSWTEPGGSRHRRPCRVFVLEGEEQSMLDALDIVTAAVDRYKELCEGRCQGQSVPRLQHVKGVDFSYQPPPRNVVPFAASLKGNAPRPPRGPPPLDLDSAVLMQHQQHQHQQAAATVAAAMGMMPPGAMQLVPGGTPFMVPMTGVPYMVPGSPSGPGGPAMPAAFGYGAVLPPSALSSARPSDATGASSAGGSVSGGGAGQSYVQDANGVSWASPVVAPAQHGGYSPTAAAAPAGPSSGSAAGGGEAAPQSADPYAAAAAAYGQLAAYGAAGMDPNAAAAASMMNYMMLMMPPPSPIRYQGLAMPSMDTGGLMALGLAPPPAAAPDAAAGVAPPAAAAPPAGAPPMGRADYAHRSSGGAPGPTAATAGALSGGRRYSNLEPATYMGPSGPAPGFAPMAQPIMLAPPPSPPKGGGLFAMAPAPALHPRGPEGAAPGDAAPGLAMMMSLDSTGGAAPGYAPLMGWPTFPFGATPAGPPTPPHHPMGPMPGSAGLGLSGMPAPYFGPPSPYSAMRTLSAFDSGPAMGGDMYAPRHPAPPPHTTPHVPPSPSRLNPLAAPWTAPTTARDLDPREAEAQRRRQQHHHHQQNYQQHHQQREDAAAAAAAATAAAAGLGALPSPANGLGAPPLIADVGGGAPAPVGNGVSGGGGMHREGSEGSSIGGAPPAAAAAAEAAAGGAEAQAADNGGGAPVLGTAADVGGEGGEAGGEAWAEGEGEGEWGSPTEPPGMAAMGKTPKRPTVGTGYRTPPSMIMASHQVEFSPYPSPAVAAAPAAGGTPTAATGGSSSGGYEGGVGGESRGMVSSDDPLVSPSRFVAGGRARRGRGARGALSLISHSPVPAAVGAPAAGRGTRQLAHLPDLINRMGLEGGEPAAVSGGGSAALEPSGPASGSHALQGSGVPPVQERHGPQSLEAA